MRIPPRKCRKVEIPVVLIRNFIPTQAVPLTVVKMRFNPLRTGVNFCHQNQNAKNIGNSMTLLKRPITLVLI
jgi:hypothetical protein